VFGFLLFVFNFQRKKFFFNSVALRYSGRDIDAMRSVGSAHKHRLLKEFEEAKLKYNVKLLFCFCLSVCCSHNHKLLKEFEEIKHK
jgi:hypothetical protein